jgi:D-3-phosphoglycerate dehydrogenase
MPANATLVNTARKEVINEDDLKKILAERKGFNYVSDIAPDNAAELKENFASQCFFTPKKMGAQTAEANINAGIAAAKQIIAFFEEGDTTFKVN